MKHTVVIATLLGIAGVALCRIEEDTDGSGYSDTIRIIDTWTPEAGQ